MAPRLSGAGSPPAPAGRPSATGRSAALAAIEYPRVLELIARHASSDSGRQRVRELSPLIEPEAVREALALTDEMVGFLMRDDAGWSPPPIPAAASALRRLAVDGSTLDSEELRAIGVLIASSRRCRREIRSGEAETRTRLASLADRLVRLPDAETRLARSFDESGAVADAASPELKRIRADLRSSRRGLVTRLERFLENLPDRTRVADASVTIRSGRYCVPVRREGRSEVGGIIHDESSTHQTLFVEPPVAIQPMNRIRELELDEAREVQRILRGLTDLVRPHADELRVSLDVLARVDALYALGRYALDHGGTRPELVDSGGASELRIVGGRHPLLLAGQEPVVPFDLTVAPDERVILVSGPNAGGKTVLLKALGLIAALTQSGIIPPVGPGTQLPVFRRLFAVVGDEQSIEASLSTFSAHVAHLKAILGGADADSLVLIDEVGANTDPAEGAALAAAVIMRLAELGRLTVATTHLGELKALAEETTRVVNASLQFDATALRPSFMLQRDRPGRSYALEIAGRLGLPEAVLEDARRRLSGDARAMEELLATLERREAEARALAAEAGTERHAAARLRTELEARVAEVQERERELEQARRKSVEEYLLAARKEVEAAIARLEEQFAEAAKEEGAAGRRAAASRARAAVEDALRETRKRDEDARLEAARGAHPTAKVEVGDVVALRSLQGRARVVEIRGAQIVAETGGVRLTLPVGEVLRVERAADAEPESGRAMRSTGRAIGSTTGAQPHIEPVTEIDLRGLRADEVAGVLLPAIDAAVVAALARIRVIHGKGTGALRQVVGELAGSDARVASWRIGTAEEGGSGVTIIELGDA